MSDCPSRNGGALEIDELREEIERLKAEVADAEWRFNTAFGERNQIAADRERLREALEVIASLEHNEECELYQSHLAPPEGLEGAYCSCCDACRDTIERANAALSSPPTQGEREATAEEFAGQHARVETFRHPARGSEMSKHKVLVHVVASRWVDFETEANEDEDPCDMTQEEARELLESLDLDTRWSVDLSRVRLAARRTTQGGEK